MQLSLIILSRSREFYTTRRLLEAAAQRGVKAEVMDSGLSPEAGLEALDALRATSGDVHIVIGRIGSRATSAELDLLRCLIAAGLFSPESPAALAAAMDKLETYRRLDAAKLPSPPCHLLNSIDALCSLPPSLEHGPWIIKPRRGSQGRDVMLARDEQDLYALCQAVLERNPEAIIQPFIAMQRPRDCRVLVIGGKARVACWRIAAPGEVRSNIHAGGEASLASLGPSEARLAEQAAAALDLSSAGVDLIPQQARPWCPNQPTSASERYAVLEVNGSPGLESIERASSLDLAGLMIEHTLSAFRAAHAGSPRLTSSPLGASRSVPST